MFFDLPLRELERYVPARSEPADFQDFWDTTLAQARSYPLNPSFTLADFGLTLINTYDVTFRGFGGQPVKAWLLLPRNLTSRVPCVVEYIGYGGGRSHPFDWLLWSAAGYGHLVMDTRGQGSQWSHGETPDAEQEGGNPQVPGFMTRGILDPATYYYRRVFTDAVRALEAARSHESIDGARIAVSGGSQGGGISLAAAALDRTVGVAMPDVPFLCHYRVATQITDRDPYAEIARYLQVHRGSVERVFQTLSYFDGVNFAAHARARALFSVGLMDDICPPRTVFAAYNHYRGPKEIRIWEYNRHEGGQSYQNLEKIRFLKSIWP
jgi:cephalosporin-C deacetylase